MRQLLKNWHIYIQTRKNHQSRQKIFEIIWKQYHKRILYFIRNMVAANAEDMLQDVMLKVYRNLHTYNPRYSFNGWIYTIARNHCFNQLKKRKLPVQDPVNSSENIVIHTDKLNPEKEMIHKELNKKINEIIGAMPYEHCQIAFLRFFEGLKCREIAQILKIPSGTVKSRLHYIRKVLQKKLEQFYEN